MRALSINGAEDVRLIEIPDPEPGPDRVLVRIETSAICGSELKGGSGAQPNPGHEASGTIVWAPEASGFSTGERVGLSAVTGCGRCPACQIGIQVRCERGPSVHIGMHADYVAVPPEAVRRVPDGTASGPAVLMSGDALGVPVRGLRRAPASEGARVLVIGGGPVGLAHTLVRSFMGCEVAVVEPSSYRRDLAQRLGADEVYEPGQATGPVPALVIESTGIPGCIQVALDTVAKGGTVLQSGECATVEVKPSATFVHREVTYTGSWFYADEDYPEILGLMEAGLRASDLVTHEMGAMEAPDAYRLFAACRTGKVLLRWT